MSQAVFHGRQASMLRFLSDQGQQLPSFRAKKGNDLEEEKYRERSNIFM
jgi:hypothetical protein